MTGKNRLTKKAQTAVKGRSPALLITIAVHVVLFFIAGAFVAVEVIQKEEAWFAGKQIVRPKMKLKKLQVPVKIEKKLKKQAPKLMTRVTAPARLKTKSVEFKMPEVGGVAGGTGLSASGLGGSLGFEATEFDVFGVRSRGEKVLILLSTDNSMMVDEVGGIPAYTVIKEELFRLIRSLSPTALYNVIVFQGAWARAFSEELSVASTQNFEKMKAWLSPLNTQKDAYGLKTLASPGVTLKFEPMFPIARASGWFAGLSYACQKNVDSVFWLGPGNRMPRVPQDFHKAYLRGKISSIEEYNEMQQAKEKDPKDSDAWERWSELLAEARELLAEDNAEREKKGQPMRVLPSGDQEIAVVEAYFKGKGGLRPKRGPPAANYVYKMADLLDYIEAMQKKYAEKDRQSMGVGFKKKDMSFDVIQFYPSSIADKEPTLEVLRELPGRMNGVFSRLEGLEAIQSSVGTRLRGEDDDPDDKKKK